MCVWGGGGDYHLTIGNLTILKILYYSLPPSPNFVKNAMGGFRFFAYFPEDFSAQVAKFLPRLQWSLKFPRVGMALVSNPQGIPAPPPHPSLQEKYL